MRIEACATVSGALNPLVLQPTCYWHSWQLGNLTNTIVYGTPQSLQSLTKSEKLLRAPLVSRSGWGPDTIIVIEVLLGGGDALLQPGLLRLDISCSDKSNEGLAAKSLGPERPISSERQF